MYDDTCTTRTAYRPDLLELAHGRGDGPTGAAGFDIVDDVLADGDEPLGMKRCPLVPRFVLHHEFDTRGDVAPVLTHEAGVH